MRSAFVSETRIPGVSRRIDPETLMAMSDANGFPLWNMPAPIRYAQHKSLSKRGVEVVQVPIYRATSASYARWVKSQLRRQQRKAKAKKAEVDALNEAEQNTMQEMEEVLTDLVLNPGGH